MHGIKFHLAKKIFVVFAASALLTNSSNAETSTKNEDDSITPSQRLANAMDDFNYHGRQRSLQGLEQLRAIAVCEESTPFDRMLANEAVARHYIGERRPEHRLPAIDYLSNALDLVENDRYKARLTQAKAKLLLGAEDPAGSVILIAPLIETIEQYPRDTQRGLLRTFAEGLMKMGRLGEATTALDAIINRNLYEDARARLSIRVEQVVMQGHDDIEKLKAGITMLKDELSQLYLNGSFVPATSFRDLDSLLTESGRADLMVGFYNYILETRQDLLAAHYVATRNRIAELEHVHLNNAQNAYTAYSKSINRFDNAKVDRATINPLSEAHEQRLRLGGLLGIDEATTLEHKLELIDFALINTELVKQLPELLTIGEMSSEQLSQTASKMKGKMLQFMNDHGTVFETQKAIVQLLMKCPHLQRSALKESIVLMRLADSDQIASTVELISAVLKSKDLNLSRANQLLRFVKYGSAGEDGVSGTPDDVVNPLKGLTFEADADRAMHYLSALDHFSISNPHDYYTLTRIHVLLDQPELAFDKLVQAFRVSESDQDTLQKTVDALTQLVFNYTLDASLAEQLVAFLNFGPAGQDGIVGTDDDIPLSIESVRETLERYAVINSGEVGF